MGPFLYQSGGRLRMENPHLHQNRMGWLNLYMRKSWGSYQHRDEKRRLGVQHTKRCVGGDRGDA